MRFLWVASLTTACFCAFSSAIFADGSISDGVTARSLGRGGTNIGHFDNGGVLLDNPGAMNNVAGSGLLDVGGTFLATDFRYAEPADHVGSSDLCVLPQFAYIKKSDDGMWAYGIGAFTPAGFSTKYSMQGPAPFAGDQTYKSYAALVKVLPGVSCQVTEKLSIGGTFGVGVCYGKVEGPYFLNGPNALVGTPLLLNAQGTGATPVWSLGGQYLLSDDTTLGLTYTSCSNFNLDGNTSVNVPGLGSTSYDSTLEMKWPQSVGAGVRHQLSPGSVVSLDTIWYDWSSAFNQFPMNLRNPTNPAFPALHETFPLAWRDTVSIRTGFEQATFAGQTLRVGYVYHRSPIPTSTLTPWIPAALEHSLSAGYGWQWNGWNIDAGYMYLFGSTQRVGASSLAGGDFNNSTMQANAHAFFASVIRPF